ncbi:MAG: sulfide dehydrogenase (flavocytochrome) flavoprotein subunit [bacterium]|nr:MAG: sulfide dehydrogenase (flavocytochrome) flavoprotein subunit [bacterium]KAF0149515.1 MAG: sulfide dehydrogenase (flavocytochrome) flavoprotein subunit [bacterium]KAF0168741.1 MAG: sulfide dehydrogenase (flavocytochrome) flavoprotein subunit [bacterium]TXT20429.1 MAG: sulfide dehydrogenase (flavocytochrome) flavoprotein subunit [bacterium]
MAFDRRDFLKVSAGVAGAASLGTLAGCAGTGPAAGGARPKVVIVGAGFGGATCARYLKMWEPKIEVTVIEPNDAFTSCPYSNTVLAGINTMQDITFGYDNVKKVVDKWVKDTVTGIDTAGRTVKTAGGATFAYDRLVLAGGIELMFNAVQGYDAEAQKSVMHAWKAGPQTATLRKQLEAMPDGGVFVMSVPRAPYRCPPGPYERACTVASYFKRAKPKSKIIVLDGNEDIASKKGLFLAAWKKHFGFGTPDSMIDYRPNNMPRAVDPKKMMVGTEFDDVKGDVINVVPPMRAAEVCGMAGVRLGLDGKEGPWCAIDFRTFESLHVKNVHILGDSTLTNFPKSGSVANNTAKMAASAIVEMVNGREPDAAPVVTNTCYSATGMGTAFHVATVFRYQAAKKEADGKVTPPAMIAQKGGGVSKEESELEFAYMDAWAKNVWADTLGLPENFNFTVKMG